MRSFPTLSASCICKAATCSACSANGAGKYVRMLDDFKMGPNLVRGFAPAGIGPRDITPGTSDDAIGGTYYWGASLEVPISVLLPAQGLRLPRRRVRRFRFRVGLQRRDVVAGERRGQRPDQPPVRAPFVVRQLRHAIRRLARSPRMSVGASIIWDSPFGPLRFDFAYPILKTGVRPHPILPVRRRNAVLSAPELSSWPERMPDLFRANAS